MSADELEQHLQASLSEGQFESQGQFGLGLAELIQKLGVHGLYHPANWSLFAVRALVRLGCHSLHLHPFRRELWMVGYARHEFAHLELEGQSASQILSGSTGLALLVRAIGGLVRADVAQVCLVSWNDGRTQQVLPVHGGRDCPKLFPSIQPFGGSLGLYVRFRSKNECDLAEHLAYPVQYCPVPVMVHKTGLWNSTRDLRGQHWLNQDVNPVAAYPIDQRARVTIPLCCDVYLGCQPAEPAGPLLLKPCGGDLHAHQAAWSESPSMDWLQPAGALNSVSSLGRYFWGPPGETQKLFWSGVRKYMNSEWGDRASSQTSLTTCTGRHILHISFDAHPDQILPILDGVALGALIGKLQIAGVTLIVSATELTLDVSGTQVVHDEKLTHWLQELRIQVREALEQVTEVPPTPPVTTTHPPLGKTMLATGGFCLAAGTLTCGVHPQDIFFLTHGGIFGGAAVSAGLRLMRKYLPQRWQDQEHSRLARVLKERLRAAQLASRSS
jgi:hypothetical protein